MSAAELLALAERVERAEGLDLDAPNRRALSDEIGRAIGAAFNFGHAPDYLASLDAAMTLVPEGWGYQLTSMSPAVSIVAAVVIENAVAGTEAFRGTGPITTPALALTAACLRARASQEPQS